MNTRARASVRRAFVGCTLLAAFAACAGTGDVGRASLVGDLAARFPATSAILAEARAGDVTTTPRGRLGLRSHLESKKTGQWVSLARPVAVEAAADGALRVDTGRGVVVARRAGARAARTETDSGALVLRDASPGVDAVLVARDHGVEELLHVRAAEAELAYDLELPKGWSVRPARGFPDRVEVCDARGVPWLRLVAGEAWAEDGRAIAVRPVIEGGNRVRLALGERPAGAVVVDPEWQSTAGLNKQRARATATLLATGQVLIAGGERGYNLTALDSAELFDPETATVTGASEKPMSAARLDHVAVALPGGKVLLAGGAVGPPTAGIGGALKQPGLASADLYDPETAAFVPAAPMTTARSQHSATLLPDGSVLVAGGAVEYLHSLASTEIYDPAKNTFTPGADLPEARRAHSATLLAEERILLAGGYPSEQGKESDADCLSSSALFDGAGHFAKGPKLGRPRCGHTAIRIADGRVLVVGGHVTFSAGPSKDAFAEISDAAVGSFSPISAEDIADEIPAQVRPAAVLLSDGRVLLAAGENQSDQPLDVATTYDPSAVAPAKSFGAAPGVLVRRPVLTPLPNGRALLSGMAVTLYVSGRLPLATEPVSAQLAVPRLAHTATLLASGDVLIAGGAPDLNFTSTTHDTLELYRSEARTFETLPVKLHAPMAQHTATVLNDGRVLLAGGFSVIDVTVNDFAQVFDPATQTLGPPIGMRSPRLLHTATLLPDGRVLFLGGCGKWPCGTPGSNNGTATILQTAELFDPVTSTFSAVGSMAAHRVLHSATLLTTGKVLVAGGDSGGAGYKPLDSAELFDAVKLTFAPSGHPLIHPRYTHIAASLADGRVLLLGGANGGQSISEIYDPIGDSFDPIGEPVPRHVWTLGTPMVSGEVMLTGGYDEAVHVISACSTLDPSSAAVTSDDVAPLSVPRLFHTATLLLDGSVLVVGGADTVPVQTASKSADRVAVLRVPLAVEAGRSQLLGAQEVGVPGAAMHLQGRFISLLGEATGGTHSSGAQLATARWVPTAGPPQPGLLLVQSDTSADWFAPAPMVPGAGVLFAVAHGLPSRGSRVVIAGAGAGVACRVDAQCATGFCSDGVCCNEVCGEACHACSAARKGRGKDGVCEAVLAGALHHGCTVLAECPADTGFCTDQGSCATCPPPPALVVTCNDHVLEGADAGQDCSPYRCAKDPATCLGSCKSKVDCVEGYACSAAGTCLPAFADAGPAGCGVSPRLRGWTVSQIMALMGALGLAVGMRRWATGRRR